MKYRIFAAIFLVAFATSMAGNIGLAAEGSTGGKSLLQQARELQGRGMHEEATKLYERVLSAYENHFGPQHPQLIEILAMYSGASMKIGDYAQASNLLERIVALMEKHLGPPTPKNILFVYTLMTLATLYDVQSERTKADHIYDRILPVLPLMAGSEVNDTAFPLMLWGDELEQSEFLKMAEQLYKRSLIIREEELGPDHPKVAESLLKYATTLRKTNRGTEADRLEARAKSIRGKHR